MDSRMIKHFLYTLLGVAVIGTLATLAVGVAALFGWAYQSNNWWLTGGIFLAVLMVFSLADWQLMKRGRL